VWLQARIADEIEQLHLSCNSTAEECAVLRDITDVLSAAGAGILSAVLNKIEEDKCGSNNFCVSLVIHDVTASMVTREDSHRLGIELVDTDLGDKNIAGSPANILWLIGAKQDELQATNGKADNVPKLTVLTSPLIQIGLGLGRPSSDYPRIISEPNKIPFTEAIATALQGFGDIVDVDVDGVEFGMEVAEHRARDTVKVVEAITLKFVYRALCTAAEALAGCGFGENGDMYVLWRRHDSCRYASMVAQSLPHSPSQTSCVSCMLVCMCKCVSSCTAIVVLAHVCHLYAHN